MELEILLPFPSAETMTESWAFSEAQIDFRHDPEAGARCTISYAAVELRTHLLQMEPDAQICFVSQRHNGKAAIELHADSLTASGDAYALLPQKDGLLIRGAGRVGVLYGVYEFLKMQGWRWLEPGTAGEYAPEPGCGLLWPKNAVHDASASTLGRGFSIEGALKESADLLIWMARNRMNAYGDRPNTRALMRKLGIVMRDGGHIFEAILAPDSSDPIRPDALGRAPGVVRNTCPRTQKQADRTADAVLRFSAGTDSIFMRGTAAAHHGAVA